MDKEVFYPAKVLLFGEYTIINGGSALAIPLNTYGGNWVRHNEDTGLLNFFEYLRDLSDVDQKLVEQAISENWLFQSNIPMGCGIGSSGALTAATYDALFIKNIQAPTEIKHKLSEIESFFHGRSSGMDPLTSYLNSPILVRREEVELIDKLPDLDQLYLYDSGRKRNSKPLIEYYQMMIDADTSFKNAVLALSRFNDRIIQELIQKQDISRTFKEISEIEYEHFSRMIPNELKTIWKAGLDSDQYYMKLSGAGGGGFFLVHTKLGDSLDLDLMTLI